MVFIGILAKTIIAPVVCH